MRDLVAGERVGVGNVLVHSVEAPLRAALALAVLALDGARRGSAAWPPLDSVWRELRPAVRFEEGGALHLTLSALSAAVERPAVVAFVTSGPGGSVSFGELDARAVAAGELRLATNNGGFVQGPPSLASAHGVDEGWARRIGGGSWPDHAPDRKRRREDATGSGVAVVARHVPTNAHVVEDARRIDVGGERGALAGELVFSDAQNDLALAELAAPMPRAAMVREARGSLYRISVEC